MCPQQLRARVLGNEDKVDKVLQAVIRTLPFTLRVTREGSSEGSEQRKMVYLTVVIGSSWLQREKSWVRILGWLLGTKSDQR